MADLSDVETMLVDEVLAALYPRGLRNPSAVGVVCRMYRGWPSSAALDRDLVAGVVNVSVFSVPGQQHNTTRFPDTWHAGEPPTELLATVTGDSVTFAGVATAGQVIGLLVDGAVYRYVTVDGDTPSQVALALLELMATDRVVLLLGPTLRLPGVAVLLARVVRVVPAWREVRRQRAAFRISFWCPTPLIRDQVVSLADLYLASQTFVDLPDRSAGNLRFVRSETIDRASDADLFRRDLIYEVEFATVQRETQPTLLFGDVRINDGPLVIG
jgi:hypothetical protein